MKRSKPNPDRKILLSFKFFASPSVVIQSKREVAELLKDQGCKVKHPLTGQDIILKFHSIAPDFRRSAIVWTFIEVRP